ncbi:filamentous hemagglutinin N-terminal domain-containing protein [Nostocales cyanobacterium LEGE 11386]|nr:filamentous hemagglutinin N-terminal domain-containing protein [Nostocales cyanobacterium LEGE 11386]
MIPDKTLPINSLIINQGVNKIIEGGTVQGSNLFHSFEQFSVPTASTILFNNSPNIQNIFSRVTSSSISNIDGLIKANGLANLFLLNPNGIVFGENARLDIGGSFLASTANSLKFTDGTEFITTNPQANSLLSINVPIGLQYGDNPNPIHIKGTGHDLIGPPFSPIIRGNSTGLRVQPGNTLAIIGGDVFLEGSIIAAEGGRIELGSVADGVVDINATNSGWKLGYEKVPNFQDIILSTRALADVSGIGSSSLQVAGRRVTLTDGSVILSQNQGSSDSGSLQVRASESLSISGTDPIARTAGGLRSETLGFSKAGDITVSTDRLSITNGGGITSFTFGAATSGNIVTNASSLEILGFSSLNPNVVSTISTATFGSGNGGNIAVSTRKFTAIDGANLSSSTFGSGKGGDITVNAADSIKVMGASTVFFQPSLLSSVSLNTGNTGNLIINTPRVVISNGGRISSLTNSSGSSGSVTIHSNSVEVNGTLAGTGESSQISSSANVVNPVLRELFRLPPLPSGNSGDIAINTNLLTIRNGGLVSAKNEGLGNAGVVTVNGNLISLNAEGSITAATASGEGGNIFLNSQYLQLRRGSAITATAGNSGNGGNIKIDTDILAALENSEITANAFEGRGGNIKIDTKALFLSPDSRITASSERGVDGTVQINSLIRNQVQTTTEPEAVQADTKIASVCQGRSGTIASTFVVTGFDGLMPSASNLPSHNPIWQDNSLSVQADNGSEKLKSIAQETTPILEAQALVKKSNGRVFLTTNSRSVSPDTALSASLCSGEFNHVGTNKL